MVKRTTLRQVFGWPEKDVRVVLSAESDPVTATCFAIGMKTYEGWDDLAHRPIGNETTFVAENKGDEVSILLPFLQTLNGLLRRVGRFVEPNLPILTDSKA